MTLDEDYRTLGLTPPMPVVAADGSRHLTPEEREGALVLGFDEDPHNCVHCSGDHHYTRCPQRPVGGWAWCEMCGEEIGPTCGTHDALGRKVHWKCEDRSLRSETPELP